ncbi:MAG: acyltransferase family protein [Erysipelotrichaceae bacterium]
MKQKTMQSIDLMKFTMAILVIAIHTAPLVQISLPAHLFTVQILARLAVPFFFVTSGYFLFLKLDSSIGYLHPQNRDRVLQYAKRILLMYLGYSVIYLPLLAVSWLKGGFDLSTLIRFVRDLLLMGTYYHLWYFPALLFASCLVYLCIAKKGLRFTLNISLFLYLIGMLGNVYQPWLLSLPILGTVTKLYLAIFVTTRNGLFFGCFFFAMGALFALRPKTKPRLSPTLGLAVSMLFLCVEAALLYQSGMMNDLTSMYLCLIPVLYCLMQTLLTWNLKLPSGCALWMRRSSILLYGFHILFITILNMLFPQLSNLMLFTLTCIISIAFATIWLKISKKYPVLAILG